MDGPQMKELPAATRTAILYQNEERDVTLIDIPTSIALAQGSSGILRSIPALEEPFAITNEPRTARAAKAYGADSITSPELHASFSADISKALAEIHAHVSGPWCAPRKLMAQVPQPRNSDMDIDDPEKELEARLREWSASKGDDEAPAFDFTKMMAALDTSSDPNATSSEEAVARRWEMSYRPARESTKCTRENENESRHEPRRTVKEPWISSFHNADNSAVDVTISETVPLTREYRFKIPPHSTLCLSDSWHSEDFRVSFRELTAEHKLPRHFNFILLDPPWPNRSVKRKNAYANQYGNHALQKMLGRMDLDTYLEHNGIVGIWITNKSSLRDYVLGPGGFFDKLNVAFFEEWLWIKTTAKGKPMFTLSSLLRKPYEVLLLGRAAPNAWTKMRHAERIKRRVIAAVPDIHSRKPCLKELIEPLMPDKSDYSALEIFSRYLVEGWTAWGNEVIKFNWEDYWADEMESEG
ncbi:MT-A70-domain-containing protein [Lindgomyces ingoldianus]|uniref:MT-A70-domain-containing protein n=1 Tax=Lindgomyces ingoldianus TaxID=673940 RepID=A0ACB6Q8W4_9PLEO|nr:MT-A70-domain-containing protein [Lindgomyces ingoldianus]KAF2463322.1 MT-A70-domain-containing protein [Lindgomyces ingoldianus]